MIYQETHTATMTCGSKCYISSCVLRTIPCFDNCNCRTWTVIVQTYKRIFEGFEPPSFPPKHDLGLNNIKPLLIVRICYTAEIMVRDNLDSDVDSSSTSTTSFATNSLSHFLYKKSRCVFCESEIKQTLKEVNTAIILPPGLNSL